jgi:hypothetical protein
MVRLTMISPPKILYNWSFEQDRNGSLYCVGSINNNREWETTQIMSVVTCFDHYEVATRNTIYHLYW